MIVVGAPAQWVDGNSTAGGGGPLPPLPEGEGYSAAVDFIAGCAAGGAGGFAGGAAGLIGGIAAGGFAGALGKGFVAGFAAERFVAGGGGTTMIRPQAPQRIFRPDNCESTSRTWPNGQIKRRIIASSRMRQY